MSTINVDSGWPTDEPFDELSSPPLKHQAIRRRIVAAKRLARRKLPELSPFNLDAIKGDAREAMAQASRTTAYAERVRRSQENNCDGTLGGYRVVARQFIAQLKSDEASLSGVAQLLQNKLRKLPRWAEKLGEPPTPWPIFHVIMVPALFVAWIFCMALSYNAIRYFVESAGQFSPTQSWVVSAGSILAVLAFEILALCCLNTLELKRRFLKGMLISAIGTWSLWTVLIAHAGRAIFETATLGSAPNGDAGLNMLLGELQLLTQLLGEILTSASALIGLSYLFDSHAGRRSVESFQFRSVRCDLDATLRAKTDAQNCLAKLEGRLSEQDARVAVSCDEAVRAFERELRALKRIELLGEE